jgi:hypothetical protein
MLGTLVSTRRATTLAFAQAGSMVAIRATLARTAMIFAARSDPSAIVLTATEQEPIAQKRVPFKMNRCLNSTQKPKAFASFSPGLERNETLG